MKVVLILESLFISQQRALSSHLQPSPKSFFPVLVFNSKAKYHYHRQITITTVFSHQYFGGMGSGFSNFTNDQNLQPE